MTRPFDDGFFADEPGTEPPPRSAPAGPPPRVARRLRPVRIALLAVILAATVGAGVADRAIHRAAPAPAPPPAGTSLAASSVESSSWYCAGTATDTSATTTLDLLNTTSRPVNGTLTAYNATSGATRSEPVSVPAGAQIVEQPGGLVGGNPVAATVELDGGGVLVAQSIAGATGWTEAACSRSTSARWYFASGSTLQGDTLAMALFNPTTTDAVVDMTFVTPSGLSAPQPFEGIVVPPGHLVTEEIDSFVQDAASVSTIVNVRTGAVVAAELQSVTAGGVRGLSLRLGRPTLSPSWALPYSVDAAGGTGAITVFNPTGRTERVRLTLRPGTSPAAVSTRSIAPQSAWVLDTSADPRLPAGLVFSAQIRTVSGPGVVVDRSVLAPSSLERPQFGAFSALAWGAGTPARVAVLPAPGTEAQPSVAGAEVVGLGVADEGSGPLDATVYALEGPGRLVVVTRLRVPAGGARSVPIGIIGGTGHVPLVVKADGPIGVIEDLAPSAGLDVVALAGSGSPEG